MTPEPGIGIKGIQRQQFPAVVGDQVDRFDDVVGHGIGKKVIESDPDPAGLDAVAAAADAFFKSPGLVQINVQQPMAIWPGTRTAAPGLYTEQVV